VGLSALALAFGICCVAPWAVTILGVSGAVLLARLAFFQPYAVAGTVALLGVGFWIVYRRPPASGSCDVTQQRRLRRMVWSAAVTVIVIDVASFAPRFLV
jgi:mercuric ion transport protein